jgi:hypothetical protein
VRSHAGKVLELVVFRLRDGVAPDQLLATVGAVSAWISRQPGFISRELAYDAEGERWIELVWWRTPAEAHAAAALATTSESCAPMFALIDMESALMAHGEPAIASVTAAAPATGMSASA